METLRGQKKSHRLEGNSKLEVSHGTKNELWDIAKQRMVEEEEHCLKRRRTGSENTRLCTKKLCPAVG